MIIIFYLFKSENLLFSCKKHGGIIFQRLINVCFKINYLYSKLRARPMRDRLTSLVPAPIVPSIESLKNLPVG